MFNRALHSISHNHGWKANPKQYTRSHIPVKLMIT